MEKPGDSPTGRSESGKQIAPAVDAGLLNVETSISPSTIYRSASPIRAALRSVWPLWSQAARKLSTVSTWGAAAASCSVGRSPRSSSRLQDLIYSIKGERPWKRERVSWQVSPPSAGAVGPWFLCSSPSLLTRVLIATLPLPCRLDCQQSLGGLQLLPPCSAQFHSHVSLL